VKCAQEEIANGYKSVGKGDPCVGTLSGNQVTIRNENHKIIGIGDLSIKGTYATDSATSCVEKFSMKIPDAQFYSVSVQDRQGAVTFSKRQLQRNGWRIELG
jgi:hypothetical protein